jgi:hypothetical protein
MEVRRSQTGSWIAAAALLLLTGTVFWLLRDYGPESALRKFHRAAVNRNVRELLHTVPDDAERSNVEFLAMMVENYARFGARYQLLHVKREDRLVMAEVAYVLPNRPMAPSVLWIVAKYRDGWRVDVDRTMRMLRMTQGL